MYEITGFAVAFPFLALARDLPLAKKAAPESLPSQL